MQKLKTIDEWMEDTFTVTSRPCRRTVMNWLKKGHIKGRKIGNKIFITEDGSSGASKAIEKVFGTAEKHLS